jgi:hypothetical protein
MARSRERGTGSVYLKEDPNSPGQKLQTWWISYYVDGKRKRESSKSRKKSDAQALLKRRMGEHALGLEIGDEEKRLTFEDLEAGFRRSYENSGRRSLRRAGNAWDRPSRALRRLEGARHHGQLRLGRHVRQQREVHRGP